MAVYHQMGDKSNNLVRKLTGYRGAILSPLNSRLEDMQHFASTLLCTDQGTLLDLVFDPQMYFPRTGRERLRDWPYFPSDVETADLADIDWWGALNEKIISTCTGLGVSAVCSPTIVPSVFDSNFYRMAVSIANDMVKRASGLKVLQTLVVNLPELAQYKKVMDLASIASSTKADRLCLIFLASQEPRRELKESQWLTGALRLISELTKAGVSTLVGCCGPEAMLYAAAGASACATGKFFNLRRFTIGRFEEPSKGGGQLPYWFEESMLAYLREADLVRVHALGLLSDSSKNNPYGQKILNTTTNAPGAAWLGDSWSHYLHWFADVDRRLRSGSVTAEQLLERAESTWEFFLEEKKELMEERYNDGGWVRPWRIALRSYQKNW